MSWRSGMRIKLSRLCSARGGEGYTSFDVTLYYDMYVVV